MKLLELENKSEWEEKGFELFRYDREKIRKNTLEAPEWIHFGAGNIFRAFPAAQLNTLLNEKIYNKGVIVSEGFDYDIIDKAYKPYDDLSLLVVLKANGTIEKKVIGSVVESIKADIYEKDEWNKLEKIFKNPSLQMASFTITEKGYTVTKNSEEYKTLKPNAIMGKVTLLCYIRYKAGKYPLALVSMDNCSHNGEKVYNAVMAYAEAWAENGLVEKEFINYLKTKVSFPWSMIDKITPRPDKNVCDMLKSDNFEDNDIIITDKNTYTAPFVNAEEAQYLVIEDNFPNGRPPFEKAGVIFTDRETVNKVEKMKVCTCLNPLHTTLAVFGCLLSYNSIHEEMKDKDLVKLIEKIGYDEGMPVVVNPEIINPMKFIKEVLEVRLPNPFMPDTPQRIATDTSQKLPIRFGETIKAYVQREDLDVKNLKYISLVFAGWIRYIMGINDNGEKFEISPDPLLDEVKEYVKNIKLGGSEEYSKILKSLLSNEKIFGVNLYEVGLADKVIEYFGELAAGKGAVRNTLNKYLK